MQPGPSPTECHGRILYTVVLWLDCCIRKSSTLFGVLVKHFSMMTCRVSLTHVHRNTHHFENKVVSLVAQLVKNPPALQETYVRSLDCEGPPGERKAYPLQYSGQENSRGYRPWGR